jgi:hypothetical protein
MQNQNDLTDISTDMIEIIERQHTHPVAAGLSSPYAM